MLNTVPAIIKEGRIELLESVPIPEGTRVLVTLIPEETNSDFWQKVSETALAKIWDNLEDDIFDILAALKVRRFLNLTI
jgi:predicted DNA-binding antitoxin AbrB/MazE fold protein